MSTQTYPECTSVATASPPQTVLQCRYCLRVQDGLGWQEFLTFLRYYHLSASDVFLAETYCEPCGEASRQVVTYGPITHYSTR